MSKGHYTGRESDLQKATAALLRLKYPKLLAFHVPNGGRRPTSTFQKNGFTITVASEGALLKKHGVMPGVADWIILHPSGQYHGLVIELKTAKGLLSPQQFAFLVAAENQGYKTAVVRSVDEFDNVVNDYIHNS